LTGQNKTRNKARQNKTTHRKMIPDNHKTTTRQPQDKTQQRARHKTTHTQKKTRQDKTKQEQNKTKTTEDQQRQIKASTTKGGSGSVIRIRKCHPEGQNHQSNTPEHVRRREQIF
jgi:hypothetical protein